MELSNTILFQIALIMAAGLLFGRLAKLVRMPNVTGYLIAGLVLGPCLLNFIPADIVENFSVASDMALGFIAFSIGSEFKLSYFKQVGASPIIIAITESLGAVVLVTGVLLLCGVSVPLSILLGAIAAATAPAQTIMVINQYRAKGSLTSMLMSVVALDDAVALIAFGFASTIVKTITKGGGFSLLSLVQPLYEVLVSFVLGAALCMLMLLFLRWFKKPGNRLCVTIGFVFGATWLANLLDGSPLLTCMALGAVLVNTFKDTDHVMKVAYAFTPPVYMIFFVMSGAGFDLGAVLSVGVIGALYIVLRVLGKMGGAWLGGKITHSEEKICRWLGPTLMPQAGVALGLLTVAASIVPDFAPTIRTIILCSTFIYSIIGPSVAKFSLVRAGEIVLPPKQKKGGEQMPSQRPAV